MVIELLATVFIEHTSVNATDKLGPPQPRAAPLWSGYGCLGCEVLVVPPSDGLRLSLYGTFLFMGPAHRVRDWEAATRRAVAHIVVAVHQRHEHLGLEWLYHSSITCCLKVWS